MKRFAALFFFLFLAVGAYSQYIPGTVYDASSSKPEPLPFAQVFWLEQGRLIEADGDGRIIFNAAGAENATLVATYVGYTKDTLFYSRGLTSLEFYINGENLLSESRVIGRQEGNYISRMSGIRTEVITAAGICKMACCNLSESFENSASVTVGYADAVTGAKQIKLLGLSGSYTQMLDENRPVMRGVASPFGMSYVPGQWLESIQIAKGPSSVINGFEAITGQINVEHRKPTDEKPFFLQLYGSSDSMLEGNAASSLQFGSSWSTVNLIHFSRQFKEMDHNSDGFMDDPLKTHVNFSSRWLYAPAGGVQWRFGVQILDDRRTGGQMSGNGPSDVLWRSDIHNGYYNAYSKLGIPLNADNTSNIALVLDWSRYESRSSFGRRPYNSGLSSGLANLLYQNQDNGNHHFTAGLSLRYDDSSEQTRTSPLPDGRPSGPEQEWLDARREVLTGAFGEYTYLYGDKVTVVAGARVDWSSVYGLLFAPRANVRYNFTDDLVFRASAGRGFRSPAVLADNLGALSTGYSFISQYESPDLEDAWTFGGNLTAYLPFGEGENNSVSIDWFHSSFNSQVIADQELLPNAVVFYNLDGRAYTNTFQADFSVTPVERLNFVATFRYTESKVTLHGQGLVERPMTSRFKGVLNVQYALPMNKWIFDFTAQINGPMKLPRFASVAYGMEQTPVYPQLFAQVTRKFRNFDVYVGGENLTGFRQENAIISSGDPFSRDFNASVVWGPLMGAKFYAGLRLTIWKE